MKIKTLKDKTEKYLEKHQLKKKFEKA